MTAAEGAMNTKPSNLPLVSVILPTRGRPDLVRLSVRAVVDQDYAGSIELVVVHDQEDADPSLCELGREQRSVTVVRSEALGLAAARNAGLKHTSGEFVASCDDDDVWHPQKIRLQMQRMLAEPDLVVLGAGIRLLFDDRTVEWPGDSAVISRASLLRSRRKELHSSTLLMRRWVFDAVGGYDENLPASYAEDYEWLLRLCELGTIGVVNQPLADIRKNTGSWFRERSEIVASALEYLLRIHPQLSESRPGHARILGQVAFAHATLGHRSTALQWAVRAFLRWPVAPHAALAIVTALTGVDPSRSLRLTRRFGRGIT
jgi:glycosyltransferase involved in cell wall biosynthesis